jgi:hypothetical protein
MFTGKDNNRCYWKVPRLLLGERWEGRPRPHFHKPSARVCHVTMGCEHALILQEWFFDFLVCFLCDRWQNRVGILFCVKLGKYTNKTVICFMRLLENIISSWQWFSSGIFVSMSVKFKLKSTNIQGNKSTSKMAEDVKKIQELIDKFVPPNTTVNYEYFCDILRHLR